MVAAEERKIEERKKQAKNNNQDSKRPADAKDSKNQEKREA
jgi:hypothetical protein